MRPLYKSLLVGAVQLALVFSIGGKLLYDRHAPSRLGARLSV